MAGVKDMAENFIDWITGGVSEDDPFAQLQEEVEGAYKYPVEQNVAREPEFISAPMKRQKRQDNVVAYPSARGPELMVIEPRSFSEDATHLIGYLQEGKTIVLNFQLLDKVEAQRLVDFVSGATRALNGNQQKIADSVFIFAPKNTTISADALTAKATMSDGIWAQRQY